MSEHDEFDIETPVDFGDDPDPELDFGDDPNPVLEKGGPGSGGGFDPPISTAPSSAIREPGELTCDPVAPPGAGSGAGQDASIAT